jgi:hypothetical protein
LAGRRGLSLSEPLCIRKGSDRGATLTCMAEDSEHRLAGAVEKFNRAKEQFDVLRAEMHEFFNRDPRPYYSSGSFDESTYEWVERFQVREPPPLRFGVILGDCVHNLRCVLDHTV